MNDITQNIEPSIISGGKTYDFNNKEKIDLILADHTDSIDTQLINTFTSGKTLEMRFSMNNDFNISVVGVYDKDTNALLHEFPTKDFFKQLTYFTDNILPGLAIDIKV